MPLSCLLYTSLNALTPQIFRYSIDEVLGGSGLTYLSDNLWVLAWMIVVVAVASGIFTYISRTNTARAGENFAKNLRDALFTHAPVSYTHLDVYKRQGKNRQKVITVFVRFVGLLRE